MAHTVCGDTATVWISVPILSSTIFLGLPALNREEGNPGRCQFCVCYSLCNRSCAVIQWVRRLSQENKFLQLGFIQIPAGSSTGRTKGGCALNLKTGFGQSARVTKDASTPLSRLVLMGWGIAATFLGTVGQRGG